MNRWRNSRIEESIPAGEEVPEPYEFWYNNTKVCQTISKDKKKIIRTFVYHDVKNLKDQAKGIEREHFSFLKEERSIRRQIKTLNKYELHSTQAILHDILRTEKLLNNRLPVLTG